MTRQQIQRAMDNITVLLGGESVSLMVEEFHPYEPAAYVHEAGWSCMDEATDIEYFVSEAGLVYMQPENRTVGIAPEIKDAADKMERELDRAMREDS